MTARRLAELEKGERRRAVLRAVITLLKVMRANPVQQRWLITRPG